jgi:hypothetical protein
MRARKDTPEMPNSAIAASIQLIASAITLGAFCFDKGSYAADACHDRGVMLRVLERLTLIQYELQGRFFGESYQGVSCRFLELCVSQFLAQVRYRKRNTRPAKCGTLHGEERENAIDFC